ncbi:MAG: hypothetical protein ACYTKD_23255 [Planctomycetota bacterium]
MAISGTEGLTGEEIAAELSRGARFVVFQYCISLAIVTFRRASGIHFIRAGHSAFFRGCPTHSSRSSWDGGGSPGG